MASADFSPFVVTDGFHTLFPSADETSLGTTRFFLSIYLPHLLQLIPSSYWTLICYAILSLTEAWCDFCSSDQRFAAIEELDWLISKILIGKVKKVNGQKVQEVKIVYNFVGEIPEIAA